MPLEKEESRLIPANKEVITSKEEVLKYPTIKTIKSAERNSIITLSKSLSDQPHKIKPLTSRYSTSDILDKVPFSMAILKKLETRKDRKLTAV